MNIEKVRELHSPVGGYSCGMETREPVAHVHSNQWLKPGQEPGKQILHCSKEAGHAGDHRDGFCCYTFSPFSDLDAVPGQRRDRRTCPSCRTSWPCKTWKALTEEE